MIANMDANMLALNQDRNNIFTLTVIAGVQLVFIGKGKLKEIAKSSGLEQVGITSAEPLYYLKEILKRRADEGRVSPFEEKEPDLRISPAQLLRNCQTVITLAVPYAVPVHPVPEPRGEPSGIVARCARGIDYHRIVEDKAKRIIDALNLEASIPFKYRILTDRSPLVERELASNSGLGWIGENCALINPRYGSYTVLGTILIDKYIEPDERITHSCLNCSKCREACPTLAIPEPFTLNPFRCLSYLTQASGIFPIEMRPALGTKIYGCDICQEACPQNQTRENSAITELAFSFFPANPLLIPLLGLTRKEFDSTIGMTSAGWRGKTNLQRNVIIALGNLGDQIATKPLTRLLENDPRTLIRLHAAWALGQIGGRKAAFALEKSNQRDPEPAVQEEAKLALEKSR